MSIINTDLVALDVDADGDKEAVIGLLAGRLAAAGRLAQFGHRRRQWLHQR